MEHVYSVGRDSKKCGRMSLILVCGAIVQNLSKKGIVAITVGLLR